MTKRNMAPEAEMPEAPPPEPEPQLVEAKTEIYSLELERELHPGDRAYLHVERIDPMLFDAGYLVIVGPEEQAEPVITEEITNATDSERDELAGRES